jgi:hypothetical protein
MDSLEQFGEEVWKQVITKETPYQREELLMVSQRGLFRLIATYLSGQLTPITASLLVVYWNPAENATQAKLISSIARGDWSLDWRGATGEGILRDLTAAVLSAWIYDNWETLSNT